MKSRELMVEYRIECLCSSSKKTTDNNEISEAINELFLTLTNFCISMSFFKEDERTNAIKWLLNHFENNNKSKIKEDPLKMINDLFENDLNWYIGGLGSENGKISAYLTLSIKNNKEKEKKLSGDYFKNLVSLIQLHLNKNVSSEIRLTPFLIEINAELIQKDRRLIDLNKDVGFSNENSI